MSDINEWQYLNTIQTMQTLLLKDPAKFFQEYRTKQNEITEKEKNDSKKSNFSAFFKAYLFADQWQKATMILYLKAKNCNVAVMDIHVVLIVVFFAVYRDLSDFFFNLRTSEKWY